jgi:hypothetical protein
VNRAHLFDAEVNGFLWFLRRSGSIALRGQLIEAWQARLAHVGFFAF